MDSAETTQLVGGTPMQRLAILLALMLVRPLPAASARLEVVGWGDQVVPPAHVDTDPKLTYRTFPPDSQAVGLGESLSPVWYGQFPAIDGKLDDWSPSARWHEVRGATALVRGRWTGANDGALRFALAWNADGILLGARFDDNALTSTGEESVLLSVVSVSPLVQRYWRGAERTVRLRADGRMQGWTSWRNRVPLEFDAALLGVRGAARTQRRGGAAGSVEFELFVPWDVFFPALPHAAAGLQANVLVEEQDEGEAKLFAWAAYTAVVGERRTRQRGWSPLEWRGQPPPDTHLVSIAGAHVEPDVPIEFAVTTLSPSARKNAIGVQIDASDWLRGGDTAEPVLLRLHDVKMPGGLSAADREQRVSVGVPPDDFWRHVACIATPARNDWRADRQIAPPGGLAFPRPADLQVYAERVGQSIEALGDWREHRHQETGVLILRQSHWQTLERDIETVEALRAALLPGPPQHVGTVTIDTRWPARGAGGIPLGTPLLRGYVSALDATTQPYTLYVSRKAGASRRAPLVVVLHGVKETHATPFASGSLARAIEARGWIAVAPDGRGDTGFQLAGERDVIDVVEQVIADLPIDESRLYVTGYSAGGTGAWLLSLRHPDLFAAAVPVSAYGDMDQQALFDALGYHPEELFYFETLNPARLVRPHLATSYRIVHAENDPIVSVTHARIMDDRLREYRVQHELFIEPTRDHGAPLFERQLENTLDFMAAHASRQPGRVDWRWFGGSGGPLATVFPRAPFVVVPGTLALPVAPTRRATSSHLTLAGPEADTRVAQQFVAEWQSVFGGEARVLADTLVTAAIEANNNLVLIGDPRSNQVLRRLSGNLPVRWDDDTFRVAGQAYKYGEAGIMFAARHPRLADRTVVVLSGMGDRLGGPGKSLLKLGADYVVTDDERRRLAVGHFETPRVPRRPPSDG